MARLTGAILYATEKHTGQIRKWTGIPYIAHPLEVMEILMTHGTRSEDVLMAAVLHDVVEDTDATLDDIDVRFGSEVMALVDVLTDPPLSAGNRKLRKQLQRERLSQANPMAQAIKCADVISNSFDIRAFDEHFWPVYRSECFELLGELRGVQGTALIAQAYDALSL